MIDLYVKACHQEHRERPSAGDVSSWAVADTFPGSVVASSDRWRIIRVTHLSEAEANMLCASDFRAIKDEADGFGPRKRLYMLPLRKWFSGVRDKSRSTLYDVKITRKELLDSMILKDEELRDADGRAIYTPDPDHAVGRE